MVLLAALFAACGGHEGGDATGEANAAAVPTGAVESTSPVPAAIPAATTAGDAAPGGASFSIDGKVLRFEALPEGHNYYTSMASQVTARPRVDAVEQLTITFMSLDLRQLEYPAELPRPKGSGTQLDPMAAMAGVGLSYRTEDGREWAGPGRVRIDRFGGDGVIVGSFTDVRLPHTDRQLPDVTITDGRFHARIGAAR